MKDYKRTKERIAFYLEKPEYNKYSKDCNIDESIRGIINEIKLIIELQDSIHAISKLEYRKTCSKSFKSQYTSVIEYALSLRYCYLEQFIKNIKQATKND